MEWKIKIKRNLWATGDGEWEESEIKQIIILYLLRRNGLDKGYCSFPIRSIKGNGFCWMDTMKAKQPQWMLVTWQMEWIHFWNNVSGGYQCKGCHMPYDDYTLWIEIVMSIRISSNQQSHEFMHSAYANKTMEIGNRLVGTIPIYFVAAGNISIFKRYTTNCDWASLTFLMWEFRIAEHQNITFFIFCQIFIFSPSCRAIPIRKPPIIRLLLAQHQKRQRFCHFIVFRYFDAVVLYL